MAATAAAAAAAAAGAGAGRALDSILAAGKQIFAVGRNYAAHAKELGNAVPTSPVLFLKPTASYVPWRSGRSIVLPPGVSELHHEVELGVVIGMGGRNIPRAKAMSHVAGYVLALDMTARELQEKAKKAGLPWSVSKGYDSFCPVSPFIAKAAVKDVRNTELWLRVNGKERQRGNTHDMLFPVDVLIEHISSIFTLQYGDVILTGTPEGVGPVKAGDVITAGITDVVEVDFNVTAAPKVPKYEAFPAPVSKL